jgi:hypothetical protein
MLQSNILPILNYASSYTNVLGSGGIAHRFLTLVGLVDA